MNQLALNRNEMNLTFNRLIQTTEHDSRLIQALIDASSSCVIVLDPDRTIIFANRAWRQFAINSGAAISTSGVGKVYPDLLSVITPSSSQSKSAIRKGLDRVIGGEEIEFQMKYACSAAAEPISVRVFAAAFAQPRFDRKRMIVVSHDVSEDTPQRLETAQEPRVGHCLNNKNVLIWKAPVGTLDLSFVEEVEGEFLGYSMDAWKMQGFWSSRIHHADRERVIAEYSTLPHSKSAFVVEYRMLAPDGTAVWVEDRVDVVRTSAKPPTMHGLISDITKQKDAESSLTELGKRLINAQEEERKRIARELHDDINQRMALVSIEIEQIAQGTARGVDGLQSRLSNLKKQVSEISNEIHRMSYELHPSKLDHLGLAQALKSFCSDVERTRGIRIDLEFRAIPPALNMEVTLCVYRVAQEALQNAAKHSGAGKVSVNLEGSGNKIDLTVSDQGNGFEMTVDTMKKGLGITSMNERVRHVGGRFQITSSRASGTVINASVPIT